ncbi:Hypothetical predicted protein, partial [Marmota monax]
MKDEAEEHKPGGLDLIEVYESFPEELQKRFEMKDVQMLQDSISKMVPTDEKYHMQCCMDSGLWVPNYKSSEAKDGEGPGLGTNCWKFPSRVIRKMSVRDPPQAMLPLPHHLPA